METLQRNLESVWMISEPKPAYLTTPRVESVASQVVDAAIHVHRELGPGLLESAYQNVLAIELGRTGLVVDLEVPFALHYKGMDIGIGYRVDMIIENAIIIENKIVEKLLPIHETQLITYLKLGGLHLGFILNWNHGRIKDGIKRMVLDYEG